MPDPLVKSLNLVLDERGFLVELLRADDPFFTKFGQAYISAINPGVVKGFYRHLTKTSHLTCVQGQIKLVLVDVGNILKKVYEYHLSLLSPKLVVVESGVWYGWACVGSEPALVTNFTTEAFDPSRPDQEYMSAHSNPWDYTWNK